MINTCVTETDDLIVHHDKKNPMYLHRTDGPAVIDKTNGRCSWWVSDVNFTDTEKFCEKSGFDKETTLIFVLKYGDRLPDKEIDV